jgi:hypothetical protein
VGSLLWYPYCNVTNKRYSSGGNDVGLLALLNQAAEAKIVAELDKDYAWAKDFNWDSISRTCEEQIANSRAMAVSTTFNDNFDNVLNAAKKKLNNGYDSSLAVLEIANHYIERRFMSQGEHFTTS